MNDNEKLFEKRHAPTDDEREALARLAARLQVSEAEASELIFAAGFRRSGVPEPQCEPPDTQKPFDLAEWDQMLLRGMTSASALDAAIEAFESRDAAYADREDLRAAISAALRAASASAVTEQGENR
ncbi:hypothetical protein SEA_PHINKY_77 [Microbacterium phage Phinky]|nr:hypothetical protein SEA_PHINKY_77 [Microbacterium phage Phinky]